MDTTVQLLDIRIQEVAQKLADSRMEVRFCTSQDLCQTLQALTARACVHKECNKLLCGCVLVYCFTKSASHTLHREAIPEWGS